MQSKIFAVSKQPVALDAALLLIRLVCGYAFILVGWGKIQHPFNWMGNESSFPGIFQALAALSEFGGGIALMLGLLTRLSTFGISCTMIVAIYMQRFVMGAPFVNLTGGNSYQLAAVYLLIMILLLVTGPGRFSLDGKIFKPKTQQRPGINENARQQKILQED